MDDIDRSQSHAQSHDIKKFICASLGLKFSKKLSNDDMWDSLCTAIREKHSNIDFEHIHTKLKLLRNDHAAKKTILCDKQRGCRTKNRERANERKRIDAATILIDASNAQFEAATTLLDVANARHGTIITPVNAIITFTGVCDDIIPINDVVGDNAIDDVVDDDNAIDDVVGNTVVDIAIDVVGDTVVDQPNTTVARVNRKRKRKAVYVDSDWVLDQSPFDDETLYVTPKRARVIEKVMIQRDCVIYNIICVRCKDMFLSERDWRIKCDKCNKHFY